MMALRKKKEKTSLFDLSHVSRGTMSPGIVYPVSFVDVLPGDVLTVEPSVFVQSLPLIAPLMGSFDICLEMFYAPDRLYNFRLFNNLTGATQDPSKVVYNQIVPPHFLPTAAGQTNVALSAINSRDVVGPNSLADFMGIPVGTGPWAVSGATHGYNINRSLTYVDVIRNYYANQQESDIPTGYVEGSSPVAVPSWSLSALDNYVAFSRDGGSGFSPEDYFEWRDYCTPNQMLFCRTYAPERLETWLNTSNYDTGAGQVSVQVTDNEVILSDARFGSHVLRYLELAMAGGSRYTDFLDAQFDVEARDTTVPVFLGSCRSSLAFDKVLQTSSSTEDSPLGNLGGQGSSGEKFHRRRFSFSDHGTFMVCLSLRPRVDYSRGVDPMLLKLNLESKYAPALDRIGFQPLTLAELDALPPGFSSTSNTYPGVGVFGAVDSEGHIVHPDPYTQSVGYQPAWSEYTTVANRLHGKLTADMRYWALARLYSSAFISWTRSDVPAGFLPYWQWMQFVYSVGTVYHTTYVRPDLCNFAFADNSPSAENFLYQVALNIRARRKKSKVNMPNFI